MEIKGNKYKSDKGKWFIRKSDSFIMGESIDLGTSDSIDNYEEVERTEAEYVEFCKKYNIKIKQPKQETK